MNIQEHNHNLKTETTYINKPYKFGKSRILIKLVALRFGQSTKKLRY